MLDRQIDSRIQKTSKSVLLLGPRQVGKSTLIRKLNADKIINLMDEDLFISYSKDPGRLKRELASLPKKSLVVIDEVQRVPVLLNLVQWALDEGLGHRFVLSGSSALKLKRGHANLLPGRVIIEHLDPLSYWELEGHGFDLDKVLRTGSLPGIYLDEEATSLDVLSAYGKTYLREEIQKEAAVRQLGHYARFLDMAAEASGQWINYSKLSSDIEIPKETVRRFYGILEDTLIAYRVSAFKPAANQRRVGQREKFVFFDLGARNALLGMTRDRLGAIERGFLFEQWIFLQVMAWIHAWKKPWRVSSFRMDTGEEVDWIIDTGKKVIALECKSAKNISFRDFSGLSILEKYSSRPVEKFVVFCGDRAESFGPLGQAVPYTVFLKKFLPAID